MLIKFWGVRGSLPAPVAPEMIEEKIFNAVLGATELNLKGEDAVRQYVNNLPMQYKTTMGGNTACIEVRGENTTIILDAGSGIRPLGMKLMEGDFGRGAGVVHILMSHTHWDHIMGFPFFTPAYVPGNRINIYGRHKRVQGRFVDQHHPDHFPVTLEAMSAEIDFIQLPETPIKIGEFDVATIPLRHPGGSFGYRVSKGKKAFIYATDAEYIKRQATLQRYIEFYADAQALVFDAQFTLEDAMEKEGWGHSSSLMGVDISLEARIKRLILFHHEPSYSDEKLMEIYDKTLDYYNSVRDGREIIIQMAVEGLVLDL